jgi:hypothetical protein
MPSSISPSVEVRVRNAVEEVYHQFEAPTPSVIEGCPCCTTKDEVDVLLTAPLRELTGQALWWYVSSVFYTAGSERDFRYFLPRILEIAINDPGSSNDAEIVLGKIGLAEWQSWSQGERDAITEIVDAWFDHALGQDLLAAKNGYDGCVGWEAEAVLCGAARAGFPLARWLPRLREPEAAPVAADLKDRFPDDLSAFWENAPAGLEELSAFIKEQDG